MSVSWTIGGDGSNTAVTADGRLNGYTTPSRGESASFEFYFQGTNAESRYRAIREYGDYPGQVGVIESEAGVPYFREVLPSSHGKSTHVVPIVPDAGVNDVGVWAAVQDVSDGTPVNPSGYAELSMDVTVIAEYAEYADRTSLGNDRERS